MRARSLLSVGDDDHPGVTAALSDTLASHGANLLDVDQAISASGLDSIPCLLGVRDRDRDRDRDREIIE